MRVRYKVWLEEDGRVMGDGLVTLLNKIEEEGSINKAAASLKMSYRQAWGLLKQTEMRLGIKLLDRRIGGESGGGATLTVEGKQLLARYDKFRRLADEAISKAFRDTFGQD